MNASPYTRIEAALEAHNCHRHGKDWTCPAHDDAKASLSVTPADDNRVLLHCHAGCATNDILESLGLHATDLFDSNGHREISTIYDYQDANGQIAYQVVRYTPKGFSQRRPDGNGNWAWNLQGVERVLYKLPKVIEAVNTGKPIYVVEGEKDADSLARAGIVATCNSGGAGKWRNEYAQTLRGANVVIVADRDEPGRTHAHTISDSLQGIAATVKTVEAPDPHKDVSDLLANGGSVDDLTLPTTETTDNTLRFIPASDLLCKSPPVPAWVWEGVLVHGAVTLFAGKPKVGKSTLLYALADAIATKQTTFLDRTLDSNGPVLYVSEEGISTLAATFPRNAPNLYLVTRETRWPKPTWTELLNVTYTTAKELNPALVIIDTFAFWGGLGAEAEKDAGVVQPLLDGLSRIASAGCAVILNHHQRKAGGDEGDAIRGSGAIAGSVDAFAEIERIPDAPSDQRRLVVTPRWPAPPVLVFSYDAANLLHRVVGQVADRDDSDTVGWEPRLLEALPSEGEGVTMDDIAESVGADRRKWHKQLSRMVDDGRVIRDGRGVHGYPYRHLLATVPATRPDTLDGKDGNDLPSFPSSRINTEGKEGVTNENKPSSGTDGRIGANESDRLFTTTTTTPTEHHDGKPIDRALSQYESEHQ